MRLSQRALISFLLLAASQAFLPNFRRSTRPAGLLHVSLEKPPTPEALGDDNNDTALWKAYASWCQQYDKSEDAQRFMHWKENFAALQSANAAAARRAQERGRPKPTPLQLSEDGDMSRELYKRKMQQTNQNGGQQQEHDEETIRDSGAGFEMLESMEALQQAQEELEQENQRAIRDARSQDPIETTSVEDQQQRMGPEEQARREYFEKRRAARAAMTSTTSMAPPGTTPTLMTPIDDATQPLSPEEEEEQRIQEAYMNWCSRNGKIPDQERYPIFAENYKQVAAAYDEKSTGPVKLNKYADRTAAEYRQMIEDGVITPPQRTGNARKGSNSGSPVKRSMASAPGSQSWQFNAPFCGGSIDDMRRVFIDWCQHFRKPFDDSRFMKFKSNFEQLEAYARRTGGTIRLNEYANLSADEYKVLKQSTNLDLGSSQLGIEPSHSDGYKSTEMQQSSRATSDTTRRKTTTHQPSMDADPIPRYAPGIAHQRARVSVPSPEPSWSSSAAINSSHSSNRMVETQETDQSWNYPQSVKLSSQTAAESDPNPTFPDPNPVFPEVSSTSPKTTPTQPMSYFQQLFSLNEPPSTREREDMERDAAEAEAMKRVHEAKERQRKAEEELKRLAEQADVMKRKADEEDRMLAQERDEVERIQRVYVEWCRLHEKSPDSDRFNIFLSNQQQLERALEKKLDASSHNKFADLTPEEFEIAMAKVADEETKKLAGEESQASAAANETRVRQIYADWCKFFEKEADDRRFSIFMENYLKVEAYARKNGGEVKINEFSDLTSEEYEEEQRRIANAAEMNRKADEERARAAAMKMEAAKRKAEQERKQIEAERQQHEAEVQAKRKADEERLQFEEAERIRIATEAEATRRAEEERRKAEERERVASEMEQRAKEEQKRIATEAEAQRRKEEEQKRIAAEAEAQRKKEEEQKRIAAEAKARRTKAEEQKQIAAKAESVRKAEEERKRVADERAATERIRKVYNDWCQFFGKVPSDSRFQIFSSNYLGVEENANRSGGEVKINEFTDLTKEEYEAEEKRLAELKVKEKEALASSGGTGTEEASRTAEEQNRVLAEEFKRRTMEDLRRSEKMDAGGSLQDELRRKAQADDELRAERERLRLELKAEGEARKKLEENRSNEANVGLPVSENGSTETSARDSFRDVLSKKEGATHKSAKPKPRAPGAYLGAVAKTWVNKSAQLDALKAKTDDRVRASKLETNNMESRSATSAFGPSATPAKNDDIAVSSKTGGSKSEPLVHPGASGKNESGAEGPRPDRVVAMPSTLDGGMKSEASGLFDMIGSMFRANSKADIEMDGPDVLKPRPMEWVHQMFDFITAESEGIVNSVMSSETTPARARPTLSLAVTEDTLAPLQPGSTIKKPRQEKSSIFSFFSEIRDKVNELESKKKQIIDFFGRDDAPAQPMQRFEYGTASSSATRPIPQIDPRVREAYERRRAERRKKTLRLEEERRRLLEERDARESFMSSRVPRTQNRELGNIPYLSSWTQNADGSISGIVSESLEYKAGTRITTSPITSMDPRENKVVTTESGSKYKLGSPFNRDYRTFVEEKKSPFSLLDGFVSNKQSKGIHVMRDWRQASDGTIAGFVDGMGRVVISTSRMIPAEGGSIVEAQDGNEYCLEDIPVARRKTSPLESFGRLFGADNTDSYESSFGSPRIEPENSPFHFWFGDRLQSQYADAEIASISNWYQNDDGTITGSIRNKEGFRNGTRITTSPVRHGARAGTIVQTQGGTLYRLL